MESCLPLISPHPPPSCTQRARGSFAKGTLLEMDDSEIHHDASTMEYVDRIQVESPQKESLQAGFTDSHAMEDSPGLEKQDLGEVMNGPRQHTTNVTVHEDTLHDMIQLRAKKDGIQNSLKSILFLTKLMIPMSVMALVMFGIFSLMSWLIPHVLCKSFGEALSVRMVTR